tara:strand:+ start:182 stop:631 length:450 start_codon:yes stop_codon:yes gene_type:complete
MLYFAYGSNMSINHLLKYCKCKDFIIVDTGYIENYIFKYRSIIGHKKTGVGNIEKRKGSKVFGVVFKINEYAKKRINIKEGMKHGIYNIEHVIIHSNTSDKSYRCFSYIMNKDKRGVEKPPTKKYKKIVMDGAINNNLPLKHIKRLNYF